MQSAVHFHVFKAPYVCQQAQMYTCSLLQVTSAVSDLVTYLHGLHGSLSPCSCLGRPKCIRKHQHRLILPHSEAKGILRNLNEGVWSIAKEWMVYIRTHVLYDLLCLWSYWHQTASVEHQGASLLFSLAFCSSWNALVQHNKRFA